MQISLGPYQLLIFAILMGLATTPVFAQSPFDAEQREEAKQIREQIQVFTDRSVYAVDETIHFRADHRVSGPIGENPWSSVLYVELIASTGEALAQGKYQIYWGKAEGAISIPTASLTGNYYLKCYTRWMRNQGPDSFSYTPLKIINPYRSEVIGHTDTESTDSGLQKVSYKEGMLELSTSSPYVQGGQEIVFKVNGASSVFIEQLNYCVTVVPTGSINLSEGQYINAPPSSNDSFRVSFLPDLGNGVSISGTVVGPDKLPVPYTTLHFSLLGENPDYFATMSDEHGRFVITAPAGGDDKHEFFVTPEQEDGSRLEVRIDQEFDSQPMNLPVEPFLLSDLEEELARRIALNIQLSKAFKPGDLSPDTIVSEVYSEGSRIPFYGTRVNRLLIDDYVRLPNLEEIFINLLPEVQFYKKQGKNRIRILSDNNSIGVYKPLIMIDHISVFAHEALLALSPEKIERIDLIDNIYLKGNVAFGGVLAIYSRKGDMAGIDLPSGSYFFDYQSFHPKLHPVKAPSVQDGRIPDTRNTLFWAGNLILEQGKQMEIPFQAPGSSGNYVVLVRGVSPNGEVYSATAKFSVE
jgi:hypothetical protein